MIVKKLEKNRILKDANVYAPDGYFTGLTPEETTKDLKE